MNKSIPMATSWPPPGLLPVPLINLSPTQGITAPHTRHSTTADLPRKPLARMGVKLYMLGALAWDYADTCCNIAALMDLQPTKALSRAVRQLRRDYDRYRNPMMRDADLSKETDLALLFESLCDTHLTKLNYGVSSDPTLARIHPDYIMLIRAVLMSMTILDTMQLYADECDRWIQSHGVTAHSILADHFRRLRILLPQFAGDRNRAGNESRRITARILLNEIKKIEIY